MNRKNCIWVEVRGRYSNNGYTTKVLANINGVYAEITRRQERDALVRLHAIGGDFLECNTLPKEFKGGDYLSIWVRD